PRGTIAVNSFRFLSKQLSPGPASDTTSLGRLDSSRSFQPKLRYQSLTQLEFLDLPARRQRELIYKPNVPRRLVPADSFHAIVPDLVLAYHLPRLQPQQSSTFLPHIRVGYPHYLGIGDLRMPDQERLDLRRIDILASTDHHVLNTSDNIHV